MLDKKYEGYIKKLAHYQKKQTRIIAEEEIGGMNINKTRDNTPTSAPKCLSEYKDLCIFVAPSDFPKKKSPLGPSVYDKNILQSKAERNILSKNPKFSVMYETGWVEFSLELECFLKKHRYGSMAETKSKNKASNRITPYNNECEIGLENTQAAGGTQYWVPQGLRGANVTRIRIPHGLRGANMTRNFRDWRNYGLSQNTNTGMTLLRRILLTSILDDQQTIS